MLFANDARFPFKILECVETGVHTYHSWTSQDGGAHRRRATRAHHGARDPRGWPSQQGHLPALLQPMGVESGDVGGWAWGGLCGELPLQVLESDGVGGQRALV